MGPLSSIAYVVRLTAAMSAGSGEREGQKGGGGLGRVGDIGTAPCLYQWPSVKQGQGEGHDPRAA